MSKGGVGQKAAKEAEVMQRIADASAPVEMPEDALRAHRANQVFIRCKAVVVERYPSLWPGESIGAAIAETWIQETVRRYQAAADEAGTRKIVMPS